MTKPNGNLQVIRRFSRKGACGAIWAGEAIDFLHSLESCSAQIVFVDPPFNLAKEYAAGQRALDNRPEGVYRSWLFKVLYESTRVLSDGGALFIYHLPRWAMEAGAFLNEFQDLTFQHWIAISMKNGFVRGDRLYPAHYALLMYTKGKPAVFNRPKLEPTKCRHCQGYIKDYGGYRRIIEQKGINLSDVWEDLSPVRHPNRKTRAANELLRTLFARIIQMSGIKGGLYVDPFVGSGTGVLMASRAGMNFSACDLLSANCRLVVERLDQQRSVNDVRSNR